MRFLIRDQGQRFQSGPYSTQSRALGRAPHGAASRSPGCWPSRIWSSSKAVAAWKGCAGWLHLIWRPEAQFDWREAAALTGNIICCILILCSDTLSPFSGLRPAAAVLALSACRSSCRPDDGRRAHHAHRPAAHAQTYASEATIEAIRQATVAAQVQGGCWRRGSMPVRGCAGRRADAHRHPRGRSGRAAAAANVAAAQAPVDAASAALSAPAA